MILGFAVMVATTVRDTRGLQLLVVAFLGVLALYMLHSLREYVGGRHVFRMGIALQAFNSIINNPIDANRERELRELARMMTARPGTTKGND